MYLFELFGTERDPRYQSLAITNGGRQFGFLEAVIESAIKSGHPFLSHGILKALNFHAIACLHTHAGEYRQSEVEVRDSEGTVKLRGVQQFRVQATMDHLVDQTNRLWNETDPVMLASLVLWKICRIHPFINGNGRTARAACYFVLCVKMRGLLPGKEFLPTLLKASPEYVPALRAVDASFDAGSLDLTPVHKLITDLLAVQIASSENVESTWK